MTKIAFLILTMLLGANDWEMASQEPNYKLYYSEELKTSKWLGYPDSDYSWEGERLSYERIVKDEEGKDVTVKIYKDPIEIIADFKPESKVFGIEGNIERNAVKTLGGALKGFIWLDKVSGGGEVVLPFTAPHIFIARGDRFNPELTEIGTDPNSDNYYEIIEGKTRVFVKSFSGIGGAAGKPPELIAHYKFNENTAGDNAELVTNGVFSAWTTDNPDGWTIVNEIGINREISEVGTGEGHGGAGTGFCNLYTSGGTSISIRQDITVIAGRKYRVSVNINRVVIGGIALKESAGLWLEKNYTTTGIKTFIFVASGTSVDFQIWRQEGVGQCDVTFDDVSIKLLAVEDSSGNDHDGIAQQDTSAISVAGKINTTFDFTSPDHIEIPDHDDFTPALTPFSISAWVYMHDATNFIIASKGIWATDEEWQFYVAANDTLRLIYVDKSAGGWIGRRKNVAITNYENQWIHLVATYDGSATSSGVKFYLNGIRVDDTNYSSGSFSAVENLNHAVWIGRYDSTYANGLIDTPTFFSLELTLGDVEYLYNNGDGREDWLPREPFLGRLNRPLDYQFRRGRYTF